MRRLVSIGERMMGEGVILCEKQRWRKTGRRERLC